MRQRECVCVNRGEPGRVFSATARAEYCGMAVMACAAGRLVEAGRRVLRHAGPMRLDRKPQSCILLLLAPEAVPLVHGPVFLVCCVFSTGSVQRRRSPRGCLRPRAPSGARPPSRCVAVTSVWLRCSLVLLFVQWAHLRLLRSYFNHLFWPQLRWVSGRAASAPRFLQFFGGGSFRGRVIHSPAFDVPAVFTCIYTWRPWCS